MEDSEDTAAAMAQAMGFSSFGTQKNPNKRRKFNPHADAVVASPSTSTIPLHHSGATREVKSGSNATPLGIRNRNEDEIDLEEDGEGEGTNIAHDRGHGGLEDKDDDDPEPQYLDPSRLPAATLADSADDIQSKIDTIVSGFPNSTVDAKTPMASIGGGYGSRGGGRGGSQPHRGQGRDPGKNWWDDYYDPSSNVNPWERLEHTRGLEPRGSWMSWEEAKG
ncbi:hypothetical protein GGS26DRAFT_408110 [Hypomontagnella submonticulosa]|nr:hypothetical protein GGS26DRAFT_408110 [Hypomontagnella submonticulosa]